jgi:hypothetical protein
MRTYMKDEFYARVHEELSVQYVLVPRANTLIFIQQYIILHTKASGAELQIEPILDSKSSKLKELSVLALITFDWVVVFFKGALDDIQGEQSGHVQELRVGLQEIRWFATT